MVGRKGQTFLPGDFSRVLMQYDDLAGAATNNIEARIQELREDGVDKELAFPNAVLALFHYPDKELRERVFRIYNEYMAELQEKSNGHFYAAGLINWWDPKGTRRTLDRAEVAGPQDIPDADQPRQGRRRQRDRLRQHGDERGVGRDRGSRTAGDPPHRRDAAEDPVRVQQRRRGHDDQHRRVPRGVLQVHLQRHPRSSSEAADRLVRGWDRLGAMGAAGRRAPAGVVPAHVQPQARARHPVLLGHPHERVVHGRPAGPAS